MQLIWRTTSNLQATQLNTRAQEAWLYWKLLRRVFFEMYLGSGFQSWCSRGLSTKTLCCQKFSCPWDVLQVEDWAGSFYLLTKRTSIFDFLMTATLPVHRLLQNWKPLRHQCCMYQGVKMQFWKNLPAYPLAFVAWTLLAAVLVTNEWIRHDKPLLLNDSGPYFFADRDSQQLIHFELKYTLQSQVCHKIYLLTANLGCC